MGLRQQNNTPDAGPKGESGHHPRKWGGWVRVLSTQLVVAGNPYPGLRGASSFRQKAVSSGINSACIPSFAITPVLLLLSSLKLICEIALMALMGQGLLAMLAGEKRDKNFFYQLLTILARPFRAAARFIAPRQVADEHVGFVAFFLMLIIWAIVTFEKIRLCVNSDMVGCR